MTLDNFELQLESWHKKPGLRAVYRDWYEEVRTWLISGTTYEIGCGIGRLKKYLRDVIAIDVIKTPWTDIVGDAQLLPIKNDSAANLVMFDVLHHLPRPVLFFSEALRVLRHGGRLIVIDPYISPFSKFVYDNFHPEPTHLDCDPLEKSTPLCSKKPFDSNQAVATILFYRDFEAWKQSFPKFSVKMRKRFAFLAYPATGGFGGKPLLPAGPICWLQKIERFLTPLSRLLAFRLMVVLEKNGKTVG